MRKVLIIVTSLASFAALAGVQAASADQASQACVNIALQRCNSLGGQCTTSQQYLTLYRQCVNTAAANAKASRQQLQSRISTAQTPTGILPKPKTQAK